MQKLTVPMKKLLAKRTMDRKNTADSRVEPSVVDVFKQTLKESLAVQVLPRLPPKLLKASEFDNMAELAEAEKEGDQTKYLFSKRQKEIIKPRTDYIKSTQNSSSFDLMLLQNNQEPTYMHKTVKISHRPQLFNKKRNTLTPVANPINIDPDLIEGNQKCDSHRKNWTTVIQDLKKHVKENSKHTMSYQSL